MHSTITNHSKIMGNRNIDLARDLIVMNMALCNQQYKGYERPSTALPSPTPKQYVESFLERRFTSSFTASAFNSSPSIFSNESIQHQHDSMLQIACHCRSRTSCLLLSSLSRRIYNSTAEDRLECY
jgi:hypothetical protein